MHSGACTPPFPLPLVATRRMHVQWAQLSTHAFQSAEELAEDIIYNYDPVPDPHGHFQTVYVFNHSEANAR